MPEKSDTFANVIEGSRAIPEPMVGGGGSLDIPQMFQKEQPNPNVGEAKDGKGLNLKYLSNSSVYLLWRPWSKCGRCLKDIRVMDDAMAAVPQGEETELVPILPDVGEYTCPHNQNPEYKSVIDRCLTGDFIFRNEEFFNMVDGTRCVHISWLEPDPEQMKKMKEAAAAKKEDAVYPPNVAEAFKDVEKDVKKPEKSSDQKDQEAEPSTPDPSS